MLTEPLATFSQPLKSTDLKSFTFKANSSKYRANPNSSLSFFAFEPFFR